MLRIETIYSIPIGLYLLLSVLCVMSLLEANVHAVKPESASCISYDPAEMVITVKCQTASLRDIDNHLNNPSILRMENADGVWLLNASIVVDKGAMLYVNSSDLSWLKLLTKQGNGGEGKRGVETNVIEVHGGLKIDSVKVTSWNLSSNDYGRNPGTRDLSENYMVLGTPRPYISVESDATGTTDISNSEIAYMGYEGGVGGGPDDGITYFGGNGSVIKNNDIHNLYFGFYSHGVSNITIENNTVHHNAHYGLDPHTGTNNMIIRNNVVHDNGGIGIICSLDCYNVLIDSNRVYNNTKMGIMFSRNMYDSVARNNIVSHEDSGIVISESHSNEIYNNNVSNSGRGIDLDKESYGNVIYNNIVRNIPNLSDELRIEEGAAENNKVYANSISIPSYQEIKLKNEPQLQNNQPSPSPPKPVHGPTNQIESNDPFSFGK